MADTGVMNSLPIFQLAGKLPEGLNTSPEVKRAFGKITFGAIVIFLGYILYQILPWLLSTVKMMFVAGILIVLLIILWNIAPHVIRYLNNLAKTYSEKLNRSLKENNPIEWLNISLSEARELFKNVRSRITKVEGIIGYMNEQSRIYAEQAEENFNAGNEYTNRAKKIDLQIEKTPTTDEITIRKLTREANETRSKANVLKAEYLTNQKLTTSYKQYGIEFSKALEVLKDNESDAKMFITAMDSSINIISKELNFTKDMKSATDGMSDLQQIYMQGDFKIAMDSARLKINDNLASIRRNLEFVSENQLTKISDTKSQSELESFFSNNGMNQMKKLDIEKKVSTEISTKYNIF